VLVLIGAAAAVLLLLVGVLAALLFNPQAIYERTHDIPNPSWGLFNGTFTYTPEQGPPSPELLRTRPDVIVGQYLADYISVAGTYPCAQDLSHYVDLDLHGGDPVLAGQGCQVDRPMAAVHITSVDVGKVRGSIESGRPMAVVSFEVAYQDGERWTNTFELRPQRYDGYFLTWVHLDCWSAVDTLRFYPDIVPTVPSGLDYLPAGTIGNFACKP
jgi:hypothetical protein